MALITAAVMGSCGQPQFADQLSVARAYLVAASASDTAALRELTVADPPVRFAIRLRTQEPQLLQNAVADLDVDFGELRGDTAVVEFAVPYQGGLEKLGMVFVRTIGEWRIETVQLSDRM